MLSQTLLVLTWLLLSGSLAQAPAYVVLDNYTIQNFFNMFTFYTVSLHDRYTDYENLLTYYRAMILLMAMSNMSISPSLNRTDTLLQTRQTFTSAPTIQAFILMEVLVDPVFGLQAKTITLMVYSSLTSLICRLAVALGQLSGHLGPTGQTAVK